jgi:hypothetical protein
MDTKKFTSPTIKYKIRLTQSNNLKDLSPLIRNLMMSIVMMVYVFALFNQQTIQTMSGPGDFRSRIVGARYIKDGKGAPYFYIFKKGDPMRYFDMQNCEGFPITNTVSPFFLWVLQPICEYSQYSLDRALYVTHLVAFTALLLLGFFIIRNKNHLLFYFAALVGTMFWDAWIMHFYNTQVYFQIMMLYVIVYVALEYFEDNKLMQVLAGCCLAFLVLFKMNFILLTLPLLFMVRKAKIILITSLVIVSGYIAVVFSTPYLLDLYKNYFHALDVYSYSVLHGFVPVAMDPCPTPNFIEGENINWLLRMMNEKHVKLTHETINYFSLYWLAMNKQKGISRDGLLLVSASVQIIIWLVSFIRHRKHTFQVYQIILLGITAYMISDFFGPVHRLSYYLAQWIIALAILIIHYKHINWVSWVFIAFGYSILSLHHSFYQLQVSVAETALIVGFLSAIWLPKTSLVQVIKT